ncbi:hypothetical protein [Variovorax sp.]|uniref:hypothetical protein n=1 Tax=Variovorax sp. TaxID=1871043 RepID=UPI002D52CFFE|nr:hypothetical protein [Variovorax sp.]HYP84485.1 hypothetical protein [Variovorax sp.]
MRSFNTTPAVSVGSHLRRRWQGLVLGGIFALATGLALGMANRAHAQSTSVVPAPLASSASPSPPEPDADNIVSMPPANWLFVQTGTSFTSDGKTLSIHGVAPQTLMFTDRPERMTGDVLTNRFVEFWNQGKDNFQKDPPNATISTAIDDKTDLVVVELTNPRLSGDTLTYDIRLLDGEMPHAGKQISVFIDWWYGPGWRRAYGPPPAPGARWGWGWGPGPYPGGRCWRGPYGALHCRPYWGY